MSETDKTDKNQINKPWLWKKGQSGNYAGRPKGTISIKSRLKQKLVENPNKLEELVDFYINNETPVMRKLLWEMIDGKPPQTSDVDISFPKTLIELIKGVDDEND